MLERIKDLISGLETLLHYENSDGIKFELKRLKAECTWICIKSMSQRDSEDTRIKINLGERFGI